MKKILIAATLLVAVSACRAKAQDMFSGALGPFGPAVGASIVMDNPTLTKKTCDYYLVNQEINFVDTRVVFHKVRRSWYRHYGRRQMDYCERVLGRWELK